MYIVTLKIEYLYDIMGELSTDYCAADVLCDAINIFLTMFDRNGDFTVEFMDDRFITAYCMHMQAQMEDVPIEYIDDNFSEVTEGIVKSLLDNVCGVLGQPPLHPMNLEGLWVLIARYHDNGEMVSVLGHNYNPATSLLRLYID